MFPFFPPLPDMELLSLLLTLLLLPIYFGPDPGNLKSAGSGSAAAM